MIASTPHPDWQRCTTLLILAEIYNLTHFGPVNRPMKWKCHIDEISITGCTGSYHFDNFQYSQWRNIHQYENIYISVVSNQLSTHVYENEFAYEVTKFNFYSWTHDVIKWKIFPCYWPFVRGIPRSLVNSPHKGQWCRALMYSLICARINGWVNNHEAGDLRRHHGHYDVSVMYVKFPPLLLMYLFSNQY